MNEVFIREMDFHNYIPAMTIMDENGDYNVYLNARVSSDVRLRAAAHELRHINKGHFHSDLPVGVCERDADATFQKETNKKSPRCGNTEGG